MKKTLVGLAVWLAAAPAFAQAPTITIEPIDGTVTRGTAGTTQRVRIKRTGDTSKSSSVTFTTKASGNNPAVATDFAPSGFPTWEVFFQGDVAATWKVSGLESPPAMTQNPLIVENVCPEDDRWPTFEEAAGRDVKVVLPKDRDCLPKRSDFSCANRGGGRLQSFIGGTSSNPARNIWIVGGKIRSQYTQDPVVCPDGTTRRDAGNGALTAYNWTGTLFIEGIHVDNNCNCEDVFRLGNYRTTSRIVVQNSRAEGFAQCSPGTHGDFIHPQNSNYGNLGTIKLENVAILRDNQAIWAPPRPTTGHGVINELHLDHVIINKRDCPEAPGDGWVFGWQEPNSSLPVTKDVRFRNTWVQNINTSYGTTPRWTPPLDSQQCANYPASANVKEGKWCVSNKDPNLYAPLSLIGRNYVRSNFTNPK